MSTVGTIYDETITNGFAKLLTVATVTSNTTYIDFTIPTGYDTFWFEVTGVTFTVNDDFLCFFISGDGGASFGSYNLFAGLRLMNVFAGTAQYLAYEAGASLLSYVHTATTTPLSGRIRMRPAKNLFFWRLVGYGTAYGSNTVFGGGRCQTLFNSGLPINFIRFATWQANQYKSGTIRLYGMRTGT